MALTIKDHIDREHYPLDSNGRALVPVDNGGVATIATTDAPGVGPIFGWWTDSGGVTGWHLWDAEGSWRHNWGHNTRPCLLPPPPRKVEVKRWAALDEDGNWCNSGPTEDSLRRDKERFGRRIVELTGSYEEPWE